MRAPDFWYRDPVGRDSVPVLRALLAPVAAAYAWAGARRLAATTPTKVEARVICVGNLTIGGTGKTPVVRAVRALLGEGAHTLSRGYGGRMRGPHRVAPSDAASEVGDEPLLHAADGAAWIAKNRVAGARAAIAGGASTLILDDGFQNPSLFKDLSILVFDARAGIGNGRIFPAGPLREPLAQGLPRAHGVVVFRAGAAADRARPSYLQACPTPLFDAWLEAAGPPPPGPLLAFAGIARPMKFFDTIRDHGGDLRDGVSFPDHHRFTSSELESLRRHADSHHARLITTEKDAVRLPPGWRDKVLVLPVKARFADRDAFAAFVRAP